MINYNINSALLVILWLINSYNIEETLIISWGAWKILKIIILLKSEYDW